MPTPREELYTTTFAVRKELKDSLRDGLTKIGLDSYGDFLTMVAKHGDEMAVVLAPIVKRYLASKLGPVKRRGKGKTTMIVEEAIKDATPDELAEALRELGVRG